MDTLLCSTKIPSQFVASTPQVKWRVALTKQVLAIAKETGQVIVMGQQISRLRTFQRVEPTRCMSDWGKACGDFRRLRWSTSRMQDPACSRAEVVC